MNKCTNLESNYRASNNTERENWEATRLGSKRDSTILNSLLGRRRRRRDGGNAYHPPPPPALPPFYAVILGTISCHNLFLSADLNRVCIVHLFIVFTRHTLFFTGSRDMICAECEATMALML